MSDEPRLPNSETDRETEIQRTADHDREVTAFQVELRKLVNRYWFIGSAEIIGSLETAKFRALHAWESDDSDDGEDWKRGAPTR